MIAEGIGAFIEVGPGNVLGQMVRWVSRQALTFTAEEILSRGKFPPAEILGQKPLGI